MNLTVRILFMTAISLASILVVAQDGREQAPWSEDFASRSPPSDVCAGGTVTALRSRKSVVELLSPGEKKNAMVALGLEELEKSQKIYAFNFAADPSLPGYWGFSGVLLAARDCITHVSKLSYDN